LIRLTEAKSVTGFCGKLTVETALGSTSKSPVRQAHANPTAPASKQVPVLRYPPKEMCRERLEALAEAKRSRTRPYRAGKFRGEHNR